MQTLHLTSQNQHVIIDQAIQVLRDGGLVVYPTETTYGIGADCQNPEAIKKLIAYKSKRDGKPLSVAVASTKMAETYVKLNETARGVYKTFLPGPVTVISKSTGTVAPGVASTNDSVGIRIPNHPFVLALLEKYGKGITATGANASYQKRPYAVQDIFDNISQKQKDMIDLVIDAGELPHNEPSTVIDTTLDDIVVHRFGPKSFTKTETYISKSDEETFAIASSLISRYRSKLTYSPLIFALCGDMGAGKTHIAKGLAQGLGITHPITSPTYSLCNEYPFTHEGRHGLFVHVDTWRMESQKELTDLSLDTYIAHNAVLAIEWADRYKEDIERIAHGTPIVWIFLTQKSEHERTLSIAHPTE